MVGKVNARRIRSVARRATRFGRTKAGDDAPRFNQQAVVVVTIVGFVGFAACSAQLYQVVSSEQGLDLGGVRYRFSRKEESESLADIPPAPPLKPLPASSAALYRAPRSSVGSEPYRRFQDSQPFGSQVERIAPFEQRYLDSENDWPSAQKQNSMMTAAPVAKQQNFLSSGSLRGSSGGASDRGTPERREGTDVLENRKRTLEELKMERQSNVEKAETKDECDWNHWPETFLGELLNHGDNGVPLTEAKRLCVEDGASCAGVTCTKPDDCTPRRGVPFLAHSPTGESSYVKECAQTGVSRSATGGSELQDPPTDPLPEEDFSQWQLGPPGLRQPLAAGRAIIVVIAHDRTDCLQRCLDSLIKQHTEDLSVFAVAVSLDHPPSFPKMEAVISKYAKLGLKVETWHKPVEYIKTTVSKIGAHFRFALYTAFDVHQYEYAVFVENDLTLAPDGLWYFRAAAWLLEEDPSLFCISSWNDNGFRGMAIDEKRLFRTDYFPGLGWMIRRETWTRISSIWPKSPTTGWDHWMRHGSGLRPRECIVPEVPRTHHFDDKGTNVKAGSGIAKLLERMTTSQLSRQKLGDLSYLLLPTYEESIRGLMKDALMLKKESLGATLHGRTYILPYTREEYKEVATKLTIYASQPRTAHRGIIIVRHPNTKATILLVDRRLAQGVLPEDMQWHPHPKRKVGVANIGQSCMEYCRRHQMSCIERELEFINSCSVLKAHFPCENGCGHQVGMEIPAYVHDKSLETGQQCLVTDEAIPKCSAQHKSTGRLCSCSPR